MQQNQATRGPSQATQARREARILIAPFVSNLSTWHQQAARLQLEVDRAAARGEPGALPVEAVSELIDAVSRERQTFVASTASVKSSRVEDVDRSFERLLSDLQRARARCDQLRARESVTR
jgi:hypothetical protein